MYPTRVGAGVPLGRLSGRDGDPTRQHLLHLPTHDVVVVPTCRAARCAWQCLVVAASSRPQPVYLILGQDELGIASRTIARDVRSDADEWARLLWPARVFCTWPGGAMHQLVDLLVWRLRSPGTLDVDDDALRNLDWIARQLPNTRPSAVPVLIDRLTTAGYLERQDHGLLLALPPADNRRHVATSG